MHRVLLGAMGICGLFGCDTPTRPAESVPSSALAPADAKVFRFRTTNLGTLGGDFSIALAVNERSEVAGGAPVSSGDFHAFLWRPNSGIRDLGTLGGTFSSGEDINDVGDVVGGSDLQGDTVGHAFLWSRGKGMQDLGVLPNAPPNFGSFAAAINNRQEVVGGADGANLHSRPFLWRPGRGMRSLGTLGGSDAGANDINDAGHVVGSSLTASGDEHAFLWTPGAGMKDLGTLGGSFSVAIGISQKGAVTGFSTVEVGSDAAEAFLWTPRDGMKRLGTLGGRFSVGRKLNTHLRVVGNADTTLPQTTYPSLWSPERGMQRLPTLIGLQGDGFGDAFDINEFGLIVGYSRSTPDMIAATLWTPVVGPLAHVQEPAPKAAMTGGTVPSDPTRTATTYAAIRAMLCQVAARQTPSWSRLRPIRARGCPS